MSQDKVIPITRDVDIVTARQQARAMAAEMGFGLTDQITIATAISELARNIVEYAQSGEIVLGPAHGNNGQRGMRIVAQDRGPGIPDVSLAMRDGYSTSGSLGLGLPGTRRLMDEFDIVSAVGKGTTVTVQKWLR